MLRRKNINENFEDLEFIKIPAESDEPHYCQPFVLEDLGLISITRGHGSWDSNDIEILNIDNSNFKEFAYNHSYSDMQKQESLKKEALPLVLNPIKNAKDFESEKNVFKSLIPNFKIFPNPVNSVLNIQQIHYSESELIESLEIIDLNGSVVLKQSGIYSTQTFLDVSSLKNGIFICRFKSTAGKIHNERFMVQR